MNASTEPTVEQLRAQVVEAASSADDLTRLQRALRALTHAPRQRADHAPIEVVRAWVAETRKEHGLTQAALAARVGLKNYGPIGAALRGRPVSVERLAMWQSVFKSSKPGRAARRPGQRRTPAEKVAEGKARRRAEETPTP